MDRRTFLAAGLAGTLAPRLGFGQVPVASAIAGKDERLGVVSLDPLVLETPDILLAGDRVTPASALFVRNHHGAKDLSDMKPRPLAGRIEVGGLVTFPKSLPAARLAELPKVEVEMVLQCSGNFRYLFHKMSPIKGTPWNKGGVGNVRFRGVPIAALFEALKLEVSPAAHFLTAEGADQPEKEGQADYEKSVPLDVALSRGLLATELNGEPLPAVHGGPVRLVVPGYYGNNHVKWVTRLRLEAHETANFYQIPDYRTPKRPIRPGERIDYTFANSDPNTDMKVNSRLFIPSERVRAGVPFTVKGVAWNDGAAELTSVDLSADRGRSWRAADLAASAGPFAFREWSLPLMLPAGPHELWARATDAFGRTQPLDGGRFWNPGGYAWNGVERVAVTVE